MTTRTRTQAAAANATNANSEEIQNVQNVATQVPEEAESAVENEETEDESEEDSIWVSLMDDADESNSLSREDIIKKCLLDKKHFIRKNNLHVKNVVAAARRSESGEIITRVTFVIKEKIFGTVRDTVNLDSFGEPTIKLGLSNNVMTSAYAVAGAMKEFAKGALFAGSVSHMTAVVPEGVTEMPVADGDNIANQLFAGGTIDVLCQYVPANTDYVNPFATGVEGTTPRQFDEDKVFHHIIRVSFGEVGEDMYKARLLK